MKALHDLSLPAPLRAAIQAVRHRLTAECSVERLMLFGSERYRKNKATFHAVPPARVRPPPAPLRPRGPTPGGGRQAPPALAASRRRLALRGLGAGQAAPLGPLKLTRVPLPPRSPNLNAYAERWVRSVKEEVLSKLILFGERSLRHALTAYMTHYHAERPTKARGMAFSCLRPGARNVRGPSNAMKDLVDSSSNTAATRHEDVEVTRTFRMVGTQTSLQEKPASITQRVTLYGISWQTYTRILTELGAQRASRLAYAHGVLEITMLSDRHETYKKLLVWMIETLTEELNLPAKSFGATTLNRADLEYGAEPDSCYYIQHVHQIEGRQVDLAAGPPPDLILGIDIAGLDHGIGHLISMTTEKRMTRYRDGLKPGSYLAILRPSTSHMVGALVGR